MALGRMGSTRGGFASLGSNGKPSSGAAAGPGGVGSPIGLLLALTKAS